MFQDKAEEYLLICGTSELGKMDGNWYWWLTDKKAKYIVMDTNKMRERIKNNIENKINSTNSKQLLLILAIIIFLE